MALDDARQAWKNQWKHKADRSPNPFALEAYEKIKDKNFTSLLDVGCGDGRDALFFAEKGFEVTAVDFSESGLTVLREKNPTIETILKDIREMDFPDDSFDVIYVHLSVYYFDDETTTVIFQNIHRMLRPDGYFFVKCKSVKDPLFGQGEKVGENMFRTDWVRHFFTMDYMREKLSAFDILELRESTAAYDGKQSAFIDAIVRK